MSEWQEIPDAQVRRLAETTFDRDVVVVAGAGTGKTTLLVNRLIHLLMREPRPCEITRLVALTFTNKAAMEVKVRLRERLKALLVENDGQQALSDPGAVRLSDLRERYGLSRDHIVARVEAALRDLEKAQIGTLHSFAAHLLRLYPLEIDVPPDFQTDDGELWFEEHFAAQWDVWLDSELGPQGSQHERWRRLLEDNDLRQLRDVAHALRSELIPLDDLGRQNGTAELSPALREWFAAKRDRAAELLRTHERAERRKIESMLASAHGLLSLLVQDGLGGLGTLTAEQRGELDRDAGDQPAGWSQEDFAEAARLIRVAKQVQSVDPELIQDLLALLTPFVQRVRTTFLDQGWISFDGLLAKARVLLRDHPAIRERLKHEYQAVLVDEFQDTDPVQYEIILYLAERAGRSATDWREVELDSGKLFIVGDPKQSIYAFRRADIEAFDQVVRKIQLSGGIVYELMTNFRSDARVLDVVNPVFDRLLRRQENVQPPNVPLVVRPNRRGGVTQPGVELRLVASGEDKEEFESAAATRLEADQLARWLKDDLLKHELLTDREGRTAKLQPGHIALLFRTLMQAQDYLEALKRYDIPYVTDGEKHFYRRQEVVDLVNLLRVLENPHDTIALVGVLRSPLGGLTDRELVELREREALDYRRADRLASWKSVHAEALRRLYARLHKLHQAAPGCPLPDAVDLLFARLPILELAAASLHGEQAVANLLKVRQMAAELADRPHLTLTGFVELMIGRLAEQPEEAESALAEESLEAVRILTIHKAKGLEFPVVVLPGFHHGTGRGHDAPVISHDWSSGVLGISLGDRCSLGAVLVSEKFRLREEAERHRLFYVGMTRAKERLILSGGLPTRLSKGTFLGLLQEAATGEIGQPGGASVHVGPVSFGQTVIATSERVPKRRRAAPAKLQPSSDWASLAQRWERRDRAWETVRASPVHLTPSTLMVQQQARLRRGRAGAPGRGFLVGTLAHLVLQQWDFADELSKLMERVAAVCRAETPAERTDDIAGIEQELQEIFRAFAVSEPYAELGRSTIVGREVPFMIPWPDYESRHSSLVTGHCVMEGVIDLIYRLDGQIWIADYKTDRLRDDEVAGRAADYRLQARVYIEAVSRCLGLEKVGFKFLFLRNGLAAQA